MAYIGNTVQTQGFAPAVDYFSGNGVTVTFTLSRPVASVAQLTAVIDNVIQNPSSAFTVSGNAITFTSAPLSGTNNIWVEYTSLVTTYAAISQDPSVIGDITATGGYLAVGDFGNTYIDGTIVDYVTGNARITTGPADGLTIYIGGSSARSALAAWSTTGVLTNTGGAVIEGLTVGKGTASLRNTVVGQGALPANTTGFGGTYIGYQTGYTNTTGTSNTFIGEQSGYFNTTGTYNTGLGQGSYASNSTSATGSYNTAIGGLSLYSNTTASENTAVGYESLNLNTTGADQVGVGYRALAANTTGTENTAIGAASLRNNTTGGNNVAVGRSALNQNTTASNNTAVGYQAAYSNTTGTYNTFIGHQSGYFVTTGSKNTVLGRYDGNGGGLDIRTLSNYIVLSDGDGNPQAYCDTSGAWTFGAGTKTYDGVATCVAASGTNLGPAFVGRTGAIGSTTARWWTGSNSWIKGGTAYDTYTIAAGASASGGVALSSGATAWASASDARLKNVTGTYTNALADIAQIEPVKFTWKSDVENKPQVGVLAQSVIGVVPEAVDSDVRVSKEDDTEYMSVRYTELIPLMIAAIQELNAKVTALEAKLEAK